MLSPLPTTKVLCILYSSGGTADVGRHAVKAALDVFDGGIRVLSNNPQQTLIKETNWNSYGEYTFSEGELERLDLRAVDVQKDDLAPHLEGVGAVVSALGNRQPFYGDNVAKGGTSNLLKAMTAKNITRLVAVTSAGCNEDWPPMQWHWAGKVFKWILRTVSRKGFRDLNEAEKIIFQSELHYLVVRPVGLGEERVPKGEWVIQQDKHKHKVGVDMSKLDCARFCVQEAVKPSYEKKAVVIGSDWETFSLNEPKEK